MQANLVQKCTTRAGATASYGLQNMSSSCIEKPHWAKWQPTQGLFWKGSMFQTSRCHRRSAQLLCFFLLRRNYKPALSDFIVGLPPCGLVIWYVTCLTAPPVLLHPSISMQVPFSPEAYLEGGRWDHCPRPRAVSMSLHSQIQWDPVHSLAHAVRPSVHILHSVMAIDTSSWPAKFNLCYLILHGLPLTTHFVFDGH